MIDNRIREPEGLREFSWEGYEFSPEHSDGEISGLFSVFKSEAAMPIPENSGIAPGASYSRPLCSPMTRHYILGGIL